MRMLILVLMTLLGITGAGAFAADRSALPERKTFQFGEFMIEASAGDEAYVEALAKQLADFQLPEVVAPPAPRLSLADLEKRKDYFLGKVCAQLGLAQPTDAMQKAFATTGKLWGEMEYLAPPGLPRKFSIWRKPELLERIDAGESVAGFTKDATGGLNFAFKYTFDLKPEATKDQKQAALNAEWQKLVWPVKIAASPDRTPEQDAATCLDEVRNYIGTMNEVRSLQLLRSGVFITLHETTESGIVWHYLVSKDRRWFCDGIANYVAWKIIEAELGPEEARRYYDLPAELKKYANEATIDLAAWPAAEDLQQANYAENINTANYAFATKVIADMCAKHGDAILPKLFAEIGKTPYEKATMDTVYRAFKKLTREDLRSYLPKPAAKR